MSNAPFSMSSRGSPTRPVTPALKSSILPPTREKENLPSFTCCDAANASLRARCELMRRLSRAPMIGDACVMARFTAISDMSNMPEQGSLSSRPRGNTALIARSKGIDRTNARMSTCCSREHVSNDPRQDTRQCVCAFASAPTLWETINVFACSVYFSICNQAKASDAARCRAARGQAFLLF